MYIEYGVRLRAFNSAENTCLRVWIELDNGTEIVSNLYPWNIIIDYGFSRYREYMNPQWSHCRYLGEMVLPIVNFWQILPFLTESVFPDLCPKEFGPVAGWHYDTQVDIVQKRGLYHWIANAGSHHAEYWLKWPLDGCLNSQTMRHWSTMGSGH